MRVYGFILAVVLLLAAAAWALNTVSPLNDKGGEPGLVGSVGPANQGAARAPGQSPATPGLSDGMLQPETGIRPDFPSLRPDRPAGLSARAGQGPVGQSTRDLIDGAGDAVRWGTGHHWSTDPGRYSDVGFLNASSRVDLPAFADVGWANAPLPVASETSLLEIVVLPALAAVLLIPAVALLVLRRRKRRPVDPARNLLQA